MSLQLILLQVFCSMFGLVSGSGVLPYDSVDAAVGATVMFSTSLAPTQTTFVSILWQMGSPAIEVITYFLGVSTSSSAYEDRITLFIYTGSLELRNLSLSDTGEYRVSILPDGSRPMVGNTFLTVYEPVSNVRVTVSSSDFVEFNSSVTLSCSADGSPTTFHWLNGSSVVTSSDRVELSDRDAVLNIKKVLRYDQRSFTCSASNPVSSGTFTAPELSISYGPDDVKISGQNKIHVGKTLELSCSSVSVPQANYTWMKNGILLTSGSNFTEINTVTSDSGEYICRATNEITLTTSEASLRVEVTEPEGLSSGAVAGITIAVLVLVAAAAAGGFFLYKNQKSMKSSKKSLKEQPVYENTHSDTVQNNVYENDLNIYDRVL